MNVIKATAEYESWLGQFCTLYQPDLKHKHKQMAKDGDPFPFFRGTYYRWVTLWAKNCPELVAAPRTLAAGDLHIENFGTWRDTEGRLCWGINDFDEAEELPYTNDLVRLATSVQLSHKSGVLNVKLGDACAAILEGYRGALGMGGAAFVLEEHNTELRAMANASEREPARYWEKLAKTLVVPITPPAAEVQAAMLRDLNDLATVEVRFRERAGMGSLGKPRYVAIGARSGSTVCREAKAISPPATVWASGRTPTEPNIAKVVLRAVRSPDPFYRVENGWIIRRLAPRCSRIEVEHLAKADTRRLLLSMGAETANVHVGTVGAGDTILKHLDAQPVGWLEAAARAMAAAVEQDWQEWKVGGNE